MEQVTDDPKRSQMFSEMRQQIAVANAQEMLTKITQKCFNKCISKPGTSLDKREERCISQCMDRFMDAFVLVSRTYGQRVIRERSKQ